MTPLPAAAVAVPSTVLELGPLTPFHEAGVLGLADLHVAASLLQRARRPADVGGTGGPFDGQLAVPLAIALTVRALREGSVCLRLSENLDRWLPAEPADEAPDAEAILPTAELPWPDSTDLRAALSAHPLVALGPDGPADRPLRLVGDRLYLQRYWADEQLIARQVRDRSRAMAVDAVALRSALSRLFTGDRPDNQRLAVAMAVTRASTIITGGPGTGKTTTVARLLAVLRELEPGMTFGLAAPTGKAAARLQEAVATAIDQLGGDDLARVGHPPAVTLHRLLGTVIGSQSRFTHHAGNPLPHDVVIVDESSMVALPMMGRLLESVRPDARLVLVGDADQLASVDAGAVLGDLVAAAPPWASPDDEQRAAEILATACPADAPGAVAQRGVVRLTHQYRFGGRLARLSSAIRVGDVAAVLELLATADEEVTFVDTADPVARAAALEQVRHEIVTQAGDMRAAAVAGDATAALRALDTHRALCAHRRGADGVGTWNDLIGAWVRPPAAEWYPGRPILVNRNDRDAGVSNGDTGVTVAGPDGALRVAFPRGTEHLHLSPGRLEQIETLRALTIHRAQGSQFDSVTVVLPQRQSPLLTRELLYTAVTRARRSVRILGTPDSIEAAVATPVRRASGLQQSVGGLEGDTPPAE